MTHPPISDRDLNAVLELAPEVWKKLKGRRIFLTGGTGFIGCWLLESIAHANKRLSSEIQVTVLTRNPAAFRAKVPHVAGLPGTSLWEGDIRSFSFPDSPIDSVIHAAAPVATNEDSRTLSDTIVNGTRRVLDFSVHAGAHEFLLVSSGAVYGHQPAQIEKMPEDYAEAPDPAPTESAYASSKREAERLCTIYSRDHNIQCKIARGYTFAGPHLPLDGRFAFGNFIRDAVGGKSLTITGDGTALRSYLYASDLIAWLLTILQEGQSLRPYNVGSDQAISIRNLASLVRDAINPRVAIEVANSQPDRSAQIYVPSTERARAELGLRPTVSLQQAICYTAEWYSASGR